MYQTDYNLNLLLIIWVILICQLFFYCYFGAKATEAFEQMSDTLYESNWPNIPNKLQKYVVVMIIYMQRPITYHGFKIADLDLETFVIVRNCLIIFNSLFKIISNFINYFSVDKTNYFILYGVQNSRF